MSAISRWCRNRSSLLSRRTRRSRSRAISDERRGRARALQDVRRRARPTSVSRIAVSSSSCLSSAGRPREDLVAQVVGDDVVVATERRELGRVSDGQGAERDSGRPALCPRPQLDALRGVQVEPGEPQELGGLVEVQGQLGRPELHDAALGPEPGDGQRRGGTRRDGHGDPGRAVRDERGERGLRRGCPQHVQVVDDEDGAVGLDALQCQPASEVSRHAGSLCSASSVTQAKGRASSASQSHSSVVLP